MGNKDVSCLLYTLSMDVKSAHFSDEQTVNNIKRGKRVKLLFARLDMESIFTSKFRTKYRDKVCFVLRQKH